MEVADPTGSAAVGSQLAVDPALTNGEDPFGQDALGDDDRSSSLSEIDEGIDNEDGSPTSHHKLPTEVDSEAETERIDESPNVPRTGKDIFLSATGYENSPSKLAQSTTYDEMDVDEETPAAEDSPSKPPRSTRSNGVGATAKEPTPTDADDNTTATLEPAGTKRKRSVAEADSGTVSGDEEEPATKRRNSATNKSPETEATDEAPGPTDTADAADDLPQVTQPSNDGTPAAEPQDNEPKPAPVKGRKGKKGKRKGKKAKEADEDGDNAANRDSRAPTVENGPEEGVHDAVDEATETGNNSKIEEECE